jgi:ferrous iron transport protein A
MCLLHMKVGEMVAVDAINLDGELRRRLGIMGLMPGSHISVKHYGWFKSTVQVMINRTLIALRKEEAQQIEVHKI